ncbi:MAG: methyltransferase domain-containing protein [Gemmatimonadota bacterium]
MDTSDAIALIRPGVAPGPATWADLGCGRGTFTLALVTLLAPGSRVLAIDRDARALRALARSTSRGGQGVDVVTARADLRHLGRVPQLRDGVLGGALLANVLHFLADPAVVLAHVAGLLAPDGRILVVEYDDRPASPWVPHPLPLSRLGTAAEAAGLRQPTEIGRRPSAYRGTMYCARVEPA